MVKYREYRAKIITPPDGFVELAPVHRTGPPKFRELARTEPFMKEVLETSLRRSRSRSTQPGYLRSLSRFSFERRKDAPNPPTKDLPDPAPKDSRDPPPTED
jgi:hypothetical protein